MAAHGAEIGVDFQVFIVVGAGEFGVEAEIEMALPVEGGAGLGEFVVAVARAGDSQGDVGGVGGDFVGDAALFHVVLFGQAEVFLGGDVAEHGGAVIGGGGGADAAGDVVVAGEDIGDQRTEDVERRAVAEACAGASC